MMGAISSGPSAFEGLISRMASATWLTVKRFSDVLDSLCAFLTSFFFVLSCVVG